MSIPVPEPVPVAVPVPEPEPVVVVEEILSEDLTCPDIIKELLPIHNDDWEAHFKKYGYTDAQRKIVNIA